MDKKKHYRTLFLFIFLVALVGFACDLPEFPGEGLPTREPGEPTQPPLEPTQPPVEPTDVPLEPTAPGGEVSPPEGDEGGSEGLLTALFWLLVVVVVILGAALIVSLVTGRKKEPPTQAAPPEAGKTPSYAETEDEQAPQPVPAAAVQSALDNISPQVAPLYDRFVSLVQGFGPLTILPTQTRVDFQRRIIFASTQFSQEDLRVQMLLPRRIDDPRMVRIEVYSEDKVSHTLVIRSLDDFDAKFTSWLEDAYLLGG